MWQAFPPREPQLQAALPEPVRLLLLARKAKPEVALVLSPEARQQVSLAPQAQPDEPEPRLPSFV